MRKAITLTSGSLLIAVAFVVSALAMGGPMMMGSSQPIQQPSFQGYYDGHKDTYLSTDISSKSGATATHINYSARIGLVEGLLRSTSCRGARPPDRSLFLALSRANPTTRRSGRKRSSPGSRAPARPDHER